jgi:hypothetical protein
MIAVLILLGFVAAGILVGLFATAAAPVGYQDEQGFHYGPEHQTAQNKKTAKKAAYSYGVSEPRLA